MKATRFSPCIRLSSYQQPAHCVIVPRCTYFNGMFGLDCMNFEAKGWKKQAMTSPAEQKPLLSLAHPKERNQGSRDIDIFKHRNA